MKKLKKELKQKIGEVYLKMEGKDAGRSEALKDLRKAISRDHENGQVIAVGRCAERYQEFHWDVEYLKSHYSDLVDIESMIADLEGADETVVKHEIDPLSAANFMRKALQAAYGMDLDTYVQVFAGESVYNSDMAVVEYHKGKWHLQQSNFLTWYCQLDEGNAQLFCRWVKLRNK